MPNRTVRSTLLRAFLWTLIALAVWVGLMFAAGALISSRVPVRLPLKMVLTQMWDQGYIEVSGTWTIENDKMAAPFQTSKITCVRQDGVCRDARAEIGLGDTLGVATETFQIVKWDAHTIVYKSEEPLCVRYSYTIDRAAQTVSGVRELVKKDDPMCKEMADRLVLHLVDGLKVTMKAQEDATPWWGQIVLAPLKIFFANRGGE